MANQIDNRHSRGSSGINRRDLLRAAAVAGGVCLTPQRSVADSPPAIAGIRDPGLRTIVQRYGAEFGQWGKGGTNGNF